MTEVQECRSCKAPVYWLSNTTTRRLAPIDAKPSEKGNIIIDLEAGIYAILAKDLFSVDTKPRHLNHFVTCPNSRSHHKKK